MRRIDADDLKKHKFLTPQVKVIGGRHGGKLKELKEQIIQAYQKGWNDCIDAIIDNAPTVETTKVEHKAYNEGFKDGVDQGIKLSERPQGVWVVKEGPVACYTACNKCDYADYNHKRPNFCPNCGANMKGGAE